jgi:hypothetical protein
MMTLTLLFSSQTVHPRLLKLHIGKRLAAIEKAEGIDFATAEALAFGSLLLDGKHVRLCGQDSGRVRVSLALSPLPFYHLRVPTDIAPNLQGTFSQRHAILTDQSSEAVVVPLQSLTRSAPSSTGTFEIVNSPLSEYSVVGFEQGHAYVSPETLNAVEMQFGVRFLLYLLRFRTVPPLPPFVLRQPLTVLDLDRTSSTPPRSCSTLTSVPARRSGACRADLLSFSRTVSMAPVLNTLRASPSLSSFHL